MMIKKWNQLIRYLHMKRKKDVVNEKEEIKYSNIIKQYKMINSDDIKKEYIEERKLTTNSWQSMENIGGYGSAKTNSLLNLIGYQLNIDKSYLYAKDSYEAKY